MNRLLLWLFFCLSTISAKSANGIEIGIDSVAPDYDQAVNLCLYHRFAEAESLLKQIIRNTDHPNRESARLFLLEELYFKRNQYKDYINFCDSTGQVGLNSNMATFLAARPSTIFALPNDSIQIPIQVRKWPIVNVLVNRKLYRFILDTGAERTVISERLARELNRPRLIDISLRNILNQTVTASLYQLDTLQLGKLLISNLPVWQALMTGFPADGLLGWDVLQQFSFTIDYTAHQLILQKPIGQSNLSRNLLGISRPLLVMQATNGNQLKIFLDTGSDDTVSLTPVGLTKIGSYQTKHRLCLRYGLGGRFKIRRERVVKQTAIQMNGRSYTLKRAAIEDANEVICSTLKDGSVGSKPFRKGRLLIDYLNNHFDYSE